MGEHRQGRLLTGRSPGAETGACCRQRNPQGGFALLLVFAMAAAAAIFLYMQLPRVAFEAQRDREEMLIERGKEYRRAVELYVRKNNRYPERLEDLERQQDTRFLRRRHKDPLTGKDDWRIIRIGATGELENSLVQKKRTPGQNPATAAELLGGSDEVAENIALSRQRSGDEMAANAEFPSAARGPAAGAAGSGNGREQASGFQGGVAGEGPGALDDGLVPLIDASGNIVEQDGQQTDASGQQDRPDSIGPDGLAQDRRQPEGDEAQGTSQPRLGPGGIPIIENPSAAVAGANTPGAAMGGQGQGQGGAQEPGGSQGQGGRSGADIISGLLTTPVPGGLEGIQQRRGVSGAGAAASQGFGAGIAGVASKYEMRGIKVFDEQDSIHKWEFVFDARKASGGGQNQGGARAPGAQGVGGQPGFNPPGRTGRSPGLGGAPPPPGRQ